MGQKRQIQGKEFLKDFLAGMTDAELIEKYQVSSAGLQKIFQKLPEAKWISPAEVSTRIPSYASSVVLDLDNLRFDGDSTLECLVPVYLEHDPHVRGSVCELAENGLTTSGISARPGEMKKLVLACQDFFPIDSFSVEAKCRWCRQEGPAREMLAAFEITDASAKSRADLAKIVRWLKL
jgi:hypothetical protein